MRALLIIGGLVLICGIASLFVPVRYRERHGINAGPLSVNVTTNEKRLVHPAVSASLIIGGVALMIVGRRK